MLAIGNPDAQPGSGIEADVPSAAVAEFRDGLLWRYKDYGNARVALAAAGLGE